MTECNISTVLLNTRNLLAAHGIEEAHLEAELLIMKAMDISHTFMHTYPETPLDGIDQSTLRMDIGRRINGEPWSYISGIREFYGLNIKIAHGVFIPRPETELLVELVLREITGMDTDGVLNIADVCTGSGAIAVALASCISEATIYATDISTVSVLTAKENVKQHGLINRVFPIYGNLLTPLPRSVDIIVSNPPYIKTSDIEHLQREISFEPFAALDGGEQGIDVITELMNQISNLSWVPKLLVVEILPETSNELVHIGKQKLPNAKLEIHTDYSGSDRFLVGKFY